MRALNIVQITTYLPYLLLWEVGLLEKVVNIRGDDEVVLDLGKCHKTSNEIKIVTWGQSVMQIFQRLNKASKPLWVPIILKVRMIRGILGYSSKNYVLKTS